MEARPYQDHAIDIYLDAFEIHAYSHADCLVYLRAAERMTRGFSNSSIIAIWTFLHFSLVCFSFEVKNEFDDFHFSEREQKKKNRSRRLLPTIFG